MPDLTVQNALMLQSFTVLCSDARVSTQSTPIHRPVNLATLQGCTVHADRHLLKTSLPLLALAPSMRITASEPLPELSASVRVPLSLTCPPQESQLRRL